MEMVVLDPVHVLINPKTSRRGFLYIYNGIAGVSSGKPINLVPNDIMTFCHILLVLN